MMNHVSPYPWDIWCSYYRCASCMPMLVGIADHRFLFMEFKTIKHGIHDEENCDCYSMANRHPSLYLHI